MVLLVGLQLVASGVGEHGLEHVWWLAGLVRWGVHEGCGSRSGLRLGVLLLLLLHLGRLAGIWDLRALLWLLLELHLGVGRHLRVRGDVLAVRGVLGSEGVLAIWISPSVVDDRTQVVMVMEVGVHLLGASSPSAAPAAANSSLVPLLLLMVVLLLLMLLLLLE